MSLREDQPPSLSTDEGEKESEFLASKLRTTQIQALSGTVSEATRVKNRRKRYLELHPGYFDDDGGLELNDPLLYDRLIRQFQSAAEREIEGRKKGSSGVLEAGLWRGEARLSALRDGDASNGCEGRGEISEDDGDGPTNKKEARERWVEIMTRRFVEGKDKGFDYKAVDEDTGLDDLKEEERIEEEKYFGEESPKWASGEEERELKGETGVQDF